IYQSRVIQHVELLEDFVSNFLADALLLFLGQAEGVSTRLVDHANRPIAGLEQAAEQVAFSSGFALRVDGRIDLSRFRSFLITFPRLEPVQIRTGKARDLVDHVGLAIDGGVDPVARAVDSRLDSRLQRLSGRLPLVSDHPPGETRRGDDRQWDK